MIIKEKKAEDKVGLQTPRLFFNSRVQSSRKNTSWVKNYFQETIQLVAEKSDSQELLGSLGLGIIELKIKGKNYRAGFILNTEINRTEAMPKLWAALRVHAENRNVDFLLAFAPSSSASPFSHSDLNFKKIERKKMYFMPNNTKYTSKLNPGHFTPRSSRTNKDFSISQENSGYLDLFPALIPDSYLDNYLGEVQTVSRAAKIWDLNSDFSFHKKEVEKRSLLTKIFPFLCPGSKLGTAKVWHIFELEEAGSEELISLFEGLRRSARKKGISFISFTLSEAQELPEKDFPEPLEIIPFDILFAPLKKMPQPQKPTFFHPSFIC